MVGTVFNIQRYTIHDGPGIRTELFLKGCPLRCRWCGNPEGLSVDVQTGYYQSKCLGPDKCGLCGGLRKDAELCPADALKQWGMRLTAEEAMEIIRRDRSYYERSGGGVTISGGEPMLQPDFTRQVLKMCRNEGIHTCVESSLYALRETVESVMEYADMAITDIKLMDSEKHRRYTGVGNEDILDNIVMVAESKKPLIIRMPVIPGVNDDMGNLEKTADFIIHRLGADRPDSSIMQLQLLEFMRLGEEKYASLSMEYPMADMSFDRESFSRSVRKAAMYFNERGIRCVVGTKEAVAVR